MADPSPGLYREEVILDRARRAVMGEAGKFLRFLYGQDIFCRHHLNELRSTRQGMVVGEAAVSEARELRKTLHKQEEAHALKTAMKGIMHGQAEAAEAHGLNGTMKRVDNSACSIPSGKEGDCGVEDGEQIARSTPLVPISRRQSVKSVKKTKLLKGSDYVKPSISNMKVEVEERVTTPRRTGRHEETAGVVCKSRNVSWGFCREEDASELKDRGKSVDSLGFDGNRQVASSRVRLVCLGESESDRHLWSSEVEVVPSLYLPRNWRPLYLDEPLECYKCVAAVGCSLVSVFNGETKYDIGRLAFAPRGGGSHGWAPIQCCTFVYRKPEQVGNRRTKRFCLSLRDGHFTLHPKDALWWESLCLQAKKARFPKSSKNLAAPRVVLVMKVVGRGYVFKEGYKMAFQEATPVKILGYFLPSEDLQ